MLLDYFNNILVFMQYIDFNLNNILAKINLTTVCMLEILKEIQVN